MIGEIFMLETAIYVRVSTEEQAQEGYSIRAQEQKLKDYVRIKDWSIYKVYLDEGISGKNITERPAINEMIEDIKQGHVKNVLVFKIDRLTRNTADLINLIELFNTYDCAFNSLTESIDTQTATGRMFIKIIGIFAEFERENIAERTRIGFERKAREGYTLATKWASYGYDKENGDKIQRINEREAVIVKEVFDMFLNRNMSFHEIAQNLNKRNIPTKTNSVWYGKTIRNVLTNCNYVGKVRYATLDEKRAFETQGLHEPIISEEIYHETQNFIKNTFNKVYKKHPKDKHYFAGSLICAKCGGKMNVYHMGKKDKDGTCLAGAYRCTNRYRKKCDASQIKHTNVEQAFSEYFNNFEDFDTIDEIQFNSKQETKNQNVELINNLNKEYKTLETKEKEVLNLYINNKVDFENYIEIKETISKEKNAISSTLETLEATTDIEEEITIKHENIIKNLKENWDLLDNKERRQFIVNFIDIIEVTHEKKGGRHKGITKISNVKFCDV